MGVKTIDMADYGYVRLYGYRAKSVGAGFVCVLSWALSLSVMYSAAEVAYVACSTIVYKLIFYFTLPKPLPITDSKWPNCW